MSLWYHRAAHTWLSPASLFTPIRIPVVYKPAMYRSICRITLSLPLTTTSNTTWTVVEWLCYLTHSVSIHIHYLSAALLGVVLLSGYGPQHGIACHHYRSTHVPCKMCEPGRVSHLCVIALLVKANHCPWYTSLWHAMPSIPQGQGESLHATGESSSNDRIVLCYWHTVLVPAKLETIKFLRRNGLGFLHHFP